jgi:hypothetical protein
MAVLGLVSQFGGGITKAGALPFDVYGNYLNEQGNLDSLRAMQHMNDVENERQKGFWTQIDDKTKALIARQAFSQRYANMLASASQDQAPLNDTAVSVAGAAATAAGNEKLGHEAATKGVAEAPVMARSLANNMDANQFKEGINNFALERYLTAMEAKRSRENLPLEMAAAKLEGLKKIRRAEFIKFLGSQFSASTLFNGNGNNGGSGVAGLAGSGDTQGNES